MYEDGIKPFNSDYIKAHNVCMWSHCTRLYKGKLWKCMPTAHLDDLLDTITNSEDWDKYKNMYTPLSLTDSETVKNNWFLTKDKPDRSMLLYPFAPIRGAYWFEFKGGPC